MTRVTDSAQCALDHRRPVVKPVIEEGKQDVVLRASMVGCGKSKIQENASVLDIGLLMTVFICAFDIVTVGDGKG